MIIAKISIIALLVSPVLRQNSRSECCVNITIGTKVIVIGTITQCKICLNASVSVIAPLKGQRGEQAGKFTCCAVGKGTSGIPPSWCGRHTVTIAKPQKWRTLISKNDSHERLQN